MLKKLKREPQRRGIKDIKEPNESTINEIYTI